MRNRQKAYSLNTLSWPCLDHPALLQSTNPPASSHPLPPSHDTGTDTATKKATKNATTISHVRLPALKYVGSTQPRALLDTHNWAAPYPRREESRSSLFRHPHDPRPPLPPLKEPRLITATLKPLRLHRLQSMAQEHAPKNSIIDSHCSLSVPGILHRSRDMSSALTRLWLPQRHRESMLSPAKRSRRRYTHKTRV